MPDMLYSHKSEIGLAELLKAMEVLKPRSSKAKAFLAKSLGFSWGGITIPDSSNIEIDEVTPELRVNTELSDSKLQLESHRKILEPVSREDQPFEMLLKNPILEATEALEHTKIELHMARPSYQPLLHDLWFRGLMSAMLSTIGSSQEIEWTILERELVRGQLLSSLPFQQRATMQRGLLLILDRSESMQPFWRDEKELLIRLQRLLGKSKVRFWWLEIDRWLPDATQIKWYSDQPQELPEKTPLLIVSDFGINGEISSNYSGLNHWLPLLSLAERYCCPQIALIPAPESYWPNELKQLIPHSFAWDSDTSINVIRRRIHLNTFRSHGKCLDF